MARYTQADVDAITQLIANGVTEVRHEDGRSTKYGSIAEMEGLRDRMQREIDSTTRPRPRVMGRRTTFTRD